MLGQTIGPYRVTDRLGEGGMGTVYRGRDLMLERDVAIKVLRPELAQQPQVVARFRQEAITLARLSHPHIAPLYTFLREEEPDGTEAFYMVMEFVPGVSLEERLGTLGRLAPHEAVGLVQQALEGLAHAHAAGVVHRDLKPANLMVTPEGVVKVMDFGIARVLGTARMTRAQRLIGTIEYMAPEQIRGEDPDARADLYAVGALLVELLTGQLPFEADTDYALMQAHLETPPPSLRAREAQLPEALDAVVQRALAKDPADRFQTAASFREALAAISLAPPTRAVAMPGPAPTRAAAPRPTAFAPSMDTPATRLAAAPAAPASPSWKRWRMPVGLAAVVLVALGLLGWPLLTAPATPTDLAATPVTQPSTGPPAIVEVDRPEATPAARAEVPVVTPPAQKENGTDLAALLAQAQAYFAQDALTTPAGANALTLSQQILQHDPAHSGALELVQAIVLRYATWGDAQATRGQYTRALSHYDQGLRVAALFPITQTNLAPRLQEKRDQALTQQRRRQAQIAEAQQEAPRGRFENEAAPNRREATRRAPTTVVPDRTPVRVRLTGSQRMRREGAFTGLEVAEDVRVNGRVVIEAGAPVRGRLRLEGDGVLSKRNAYLRIQSVRDVQGRTLRLTSSNIRVDEDKAGMVILARVMQ
ncbi:MAG: protein kinase [Bacteroidota bacterium]